MRRDMRKAAKSAKLSDTEKKEQNKLYNEKRMNNRKKKKQLEVSDVTLKNDNDNGMVFSQSCL